MYKVHLWVNWSLYQVEHCLIFHSGLYLLALTLIWLYLISKKYCYKRDNRLVLSFIILILFGGVEVWGINVYLNNFESFYVMRLILLFSKNLTSVSERKWKYSRYHYRWVKPRGTSRGFLLMIFPLGSFLYLKTQFTWDDISSFGNPFCSLKNRFRFFMFCNSIFTSSNHLSISIRLNISLKYFGSLRFLSWDKTLGFVIGTTEFILLLGLYK